MPVEKSREGVVDLYYWTYYTYNLGKFVGRSVGWVGNHVSDWECMMVRTVDGEPISVDYRSFWSYFVFVLFSGSCWADGLYFPLFLYSESYGKIQLWHDAVE